MVKCLGLGIEFWYSQGYVALFDIYNKYNKKGKFRKELCIYIKIVWKIVFQDCLEDEFKG